MSKSHSPFRASKLAPWEIEAAARLKTLFEARAGVTQKSFGQTYGIGVGAMVSQYLNAKRPISLPTAIKFARGLCVSVNDISPTLAAQLPQSPVGNEFPSHPHAQAQMERAKALSDQAATLGPKEAMAGLSELVRALHPTLANAGRDALRQWVDGTIDAERAADTREALTHVSENMKIAHPPLPIKKQSNG